MWRITGAWLLGLGVCLSGCDDSKTGPGGGEPETVSDRDGGLPSAGETETETSTDAKPGVTPEVGDTDFVSAASSSENGARSGGGGAQSAATNGSFAEAAEDEAAAPVAAGAAARTVERGDIFRVLGDGRILNFNPYRGLQVIDVRDPSAPAVEGRLALHGSPVEMYVVDDRAILLLNRWTGYYGRYEDLRVEQREGGVLAVVDIADRSAPELLGQHLIRGDISTSRLTQGGDQAALYVASQQYETFVVSEDGGDADVGVTGPSAPKTILTSFDVSSGRIVKRNELDLGGYVQDIQATADVMMVASYDYTRADTTSRVTLVDISDPGGQMVLGDEVITRGIVQNKFNMDLYNGVLRVVSGGDWRQIGNWVETYDARDLRDVRPLDACQFGDEQSLFATLFVDNSAFFVTYFRQDPFHAFAIADDGSCVEHNEFVVSGWNDFFRAVADDGRLIGIGKNDEGPGATLAVSLYDITDLSEPEPLVARAEVDLKWSSSEGSWDDRAFSVLEDATAVLAADGTEETGLVLLPFEGYDSSTGQYQTGVQLFTFSDSTLTLRGIMEQNSAVRRSFLADDALAANLSDTDLTVYDVAVPDEPELLGQLELAPNYQQVYRFSGHVARVKVPTNNRYYYYDDGRTSEDRKIVQVLDEGADPETTAPVAAFEVPGDAQLVQVGDLLVSYTMHYKSVDSSGVGGFQDEPRQIYETVLQVHDLSDPARPRERGSLTTDELQPNYRGWYGPLVGIAEDVACFDCFYPSASPALATDSALVFQRTEAQQELLGTGERCYEYIHYDRMLCGSNRPRPVDLAPSGGTAGVASSGVAVMGGSAVPDAPPPADAGVAEAALLRDDDAVCYDGYRDCFYGDDGSEACTGEFIRCTPDEGCESIASEDLPFRTSRECYPYDKYRNWQSYTFLVVNFTDPDAPVLEDAIAMPKDHGGTSTLVRGDSVYFNWERPFDKPGDPRPHVKRYFQTIDLSDPGEPEISRPINIPGAVIEVDGDQVLTRDLVWDSADTESLLALLTVRNDRARLKAQRLFDDRSLEAVMVDGAGHLLVSHAPIYRYVPFDRSEVSADLHKLSLLSLMDLTVLGETDVDTWASLVAAEQGRALFTVSGGLLMVNVEQPKKPFAQAFFTTNGFYGLQSLIFDRDRILLAGGPYGIYNFSVDEKNLLTP